jgi:tol-pal system protein YbgF
MFNMKQCSTFKKARHVSGLLVLLAAVGFSASAFAQSTSELQNRIKRLENEVQTLNRAVYRGEKPPLGSVPSAGSAASADTEIRMQQMENELREMRGKIEELSFENRQLRNELDRTASDLKLRVKDLEGGQMSSSVSSDPVVPSRPVASETAPSQPAAAESDAGYQWSSDNLEKPQGGQLGQISQSPSGAVNPSADLATATYDNAFSLLKKNNYDTAQREFEGFLNKYPDHALAGNAKYWLGETHYVRGDYEVAARIFAEGYQQYPDNAKTADNLLKLGMSLGAMGKTQDACVALGQLDKENLPSSGPVMRRAEQERTRLNCN